MPIITITSGIYSNAENIVEKLSAHIGFKVLTDNDIFLETNREYDIKVTTLNKVVDNKPLIFNDLIHTRERCVACLKKTVSKYVSQGKYVFHGLLGHLVPSLTTHVMKVLIIASKEVREQNGTNQHGLSEKEVVKNIKNSDKSAFLWTNSLFEKKAWDKSLYDMVIPTDKVSVDEACELIMEHFNRLSKIPAEVIAKENRDFMLAAEIDLVLSKVGAGLLVAVEDGNVVVTIDKNVLLLTKLQQKISRLVQDIDGVKSVETKTGKHYHKADIMFNLDFETPSRILLVDDEKEFVQTLSERLKLRKVENSFVFSGEEALGFADRKETDVMVLDLKMPGIDGFEVLKRIKKTNPKIEVIILTGHGSEEDRKTCMDLGAFAYLQKPADIDLLTATMKEAYEKARA
ncbi:response regulator [bacterium]|nr:response regulator [bacterium]